MRGRSAEGSEPVGIASDRSGRGGWAAYYENPPEVAEAMDFPLIYPRFENPHRFSVKRILLTRKDKPVKVCIDSAGEVHTDPLPEGDAWCAEHLRYAIGVFRQAHKMGNPRLNEGLRGIESSPIPKKSADRCRRNVVMRRKVQSR